VRAYLAMMQARRALIFGHQGHTTRRGTAARPSWVLRHRHPGGRRGTTWCGSDSAKTTRSKKLAWSSHQPCPPGRGILRIIPAWLALFPVGTEGMRGMEEGCGGNNGAAMIFEGASCWPDAPAGK
jgi:hypothetical protein